MSTILTPKEVLKRFFTADPIYNQVDVEVVEDSKLFNSSSNNGYTVFNYNNFNFVQEYDEVYETDSLIINYSVVIRDDSGNGIAFITKVQSK